VNVPLLDYNMLKGVVQSISWRFGQSLQTPNHPLPLEIKQENDFCPKAIELAAATSMSVLEPREPRMPHSTGNATMNQPFLHPSSQQSDMATQSGDLN